MRIIGLTLVVALAGTTGAVAQHAPPPLFKPIQPIHPSSWITNNDYPDLARRQGKQGVTTFRLLIDTSGKVTDCKVVATSGSDLLDQTTCRLLLKRARFIPGQGSHGENIPATYTNRFVWSL